MRCVGINRAGNRCRNFHLGQIEPQGWNDDPCLCPSHNNADNRMDPIEWIQSKPEGLPEKYPYVWIPKDKERASAKAQ